MEKQIALQYGLNLPSFHPLASNYATSKNGYLYILQPYIETEEILYERMVLAQVLQNLGHKDVCVFLKTKSQGQVCEIDEKRYVLLMVPLMEKEKFQYTAGYSLAHFHLGGRRVPIEIEEISRIGKWKDLWVKRLDQLESFWNERIFHVPETEFDELFISSFPYYRGLAENAIAYFVDTELDEEPTALDGGTICHYHLTTELWGQTYLYKNPFDWVFDHCARDIAEYIRQLLLANDEEVFLKIQQFLIDYQKLYRLSPFGIRLIYARLMFPIHYFEVVEDYYLINRDDFRNELTGKMNDLLEQSATYEKVLTIFYQQYFPNQRSSLPPVDWLFIK